MLDCCPLPCASVPLPNTHALIQLHVNIQESLGCFKLMLMQIRMCRKMEVAIRRLRL